MSYYYCAVTVAPSPLARHLPVSYAYIYIARGCAGFLLPRPPRDRQQQLKRAEFSPCMAVHRSPTRRGGSKADVCIIDLNTLSSWVSTRSWGVRVFDRKIVPGLQETYIRGPLHIIRDGTLDEWNGRAIHSILPQVTDYCMFLSVSSFL